MNTRHRRTTFQPAPSPLRDELEGMKATRGIVLGLALSSPFWFAAAGILAIAQELGR
jgi:hypothetical protein